MKKLFCFIMFLTLSLPSIAQEETNNEFGFELGGNVHLSMQKWGSEDNSSGPATDNESNIGYGVGFLFGGGLRFDATSKLIAGFHYQYNIIEINYTDSTTISDGWQTDMYDVGLGIQADMGDLFMTMAFGFSQISQVTTISGVEYTQHSYDGGNGSCSFVDIGAGFKSGIFFIGISITAYQGEVGDSTLKYDASEFNRTGFYAGIAI